MTRVLLGKLLLRLALTGSPAQGWEANLKGRFMDFFQGVGEASHINSFLVMQVSWKMLHKC